IFYYKCDILAGGRNPKVPYLADQFRRHAPEFADRPVRNLKDGAALLDVDAELIGRPGAKRSAERVAPGELELPERWQPSRRRALRRSRVGRGWRRGAIRHNPRRQRRGAGGGSGSGSTRSDRLKAHAHNLIQRNGLLKV